MSNREQAAALLMREVLCEKIYREREKWDPEHPNMALGVRSILPRDLMPFVGTHLLRLSPDSMKLYAAKVLDLLEDGAETVVQAALAMRAVPDADRGWCYATDSHGENWNECESATTREQAIAEATAYAAEHNFKPARIGWKRTYTHDDFVGSLGEDLRETIANRAHDEASDHADDYPDMKAEPFDNAVEAFVLEWLVENAEQPRFFTVEGEEEVPLP